MLIATTCKPFRGADALRQRNALLSWKQITEDVRIVVFGKEASVFCAEHNIENRGVKRRNGLPLLSDIFKQSIELAGEDIVCYMNSDVMVGDDFVMVPQQINKKYEEFVIVGQRWDVRIDWEIDFSKDWRTMLQNHARKYAKLHPEWGMDYFIWQGDIYDNIPDFMVGVVGFDNWLVWKAIYDGALVLNATDVISIIHQEHGGTKQPRIGENATYNKTLAQTNGCYLLVGINNATRIGRIQ